MFTVAEQMARLKIPCLSPYLSKHANCSWRALDMSAALMIEFCRETGMTCISQELFAAGGFAIPAAPAAIDCISTIINRPSKSAAIPIRIDHVALARKSRES